MWWPLCLLFLVVAEARRDRNLAVSYALYALPPFRVELETPTDLLPSSGLQARLHEPLKLITGEFLMESFEIAMTSGQHPDFVYQLATLELSVDIEVESTSATYSEISAYFTGSAAFVDAGHKPSPEAMVALLDEWTKQALTTDKSIYINYLDQSTEPMLSKHHWLTIELYATPKTSTTAATKSAVDKGVIAACVFVAAAAIAFFLYVARPQLVRRRRPRKSLFDQPTTPDQVLPGRCEALEESDRYLQEFRPDLLQAVRRATPPTSGREEDDPARVEASQYRSPSSESWWTRIARTLGHAPLACDEDPSSYRFAFRDFPRHDGTPCLIYNKSGTEAVFISTPPREEKESDEDFLQKLQAASAITSSSFDEDEENDGAFTNKLERLVAMRHRHYERERILERSREARRQRELEEQAKERELRLRRHEMELDLEEIEATLTPRAMSSRKSTNLDENLQVRSHRATMSDSDYCIGDFEIGDIDLAPPPPPASGARPPRPTPSSKTSHAEQSVSSQDGDNGPVVRKIKRHSSHRRSTSHGSGLSSLADEKKTAEDVMTFGIAAYTEFV